MLSTTNERMQNAIDDTHDSGYKIGVVIANVDPDGLGRIQCRVPNLFEPSQGPVPWIGPSRLSPFGQGPGFGVYGSPAIGAVVRIHLQDDDGHYPVYISDEYIQPNANATYASPNTWGFVDPSGNKLFVNMATGDWQFTHKSGSSMFYNNAGDINLTVHNNLNINITGNATIAASGTVHISGSQVNLN